MSSSTEEIKERLPVLEVVSSYVKLERAGQNYKARCPFQIEKTGLIIKSEKGYYDRFRGRITFPVAKAEGKIVGFSGRHFVPGVKEEGAKYINTSETLLYNKSKILYGFDKAKQSIMREDR